MKKRLWIAGIAAVVFLFSGTALFPQVRVWPFAPFLAVLFYRATFLRALWGSFFAGLAMDLTSSQFSFGIHAVAHCIACLFLYSQKRHFFEDKPIPFSLYSALISVVLSLSLLLFASVSDGQIPLNSSIFFSELIVMPFSDAIYAFTWFALPALLYGYIRKHILLRRTLSEDT